MTMVRNAGPPVENDRERLNRNFAELMQEFRVAQTGVQILFAFLLTLPFTNRFGQVGPRDVVAYAIAAVGAAVATVVLIAPVSIHRAWFRAGRKPELVTLASRLAQVGTFSFGVALASAVFLIFDVAIGFWWGVGFTALVVVLAGGLWYVVPAAGGRRPR
jgi:hypothetical protein